MDKLTDKDARIMTSSEDLYREIKDLINNFPTYPDLDSLIANGDVAKVRGGYHVLTETGMEAIKSYIIGLSIASNGKPLFQLSRRRKNSKVPIPKR